MADGEELAGETGVGIHERYTYSKVFCRKPAGTASAPRLLRKGFKFSDDAVELFNESV